MCHRNSSANRFHILEHFSDEENEEGEVLTDAPCQGTSPIFFCDYLAIAEDKIGSYGKKKGIRKQKAFENRNRKKDNARRGTSSAGLDHGSNASLQSRTTDNVDDPLVEERDFGWFKICKGKFVRKNLDPLQESKQALGVGKPDPMLLRPPTGDSITNLVNDLGGS
jgi:hypothetical protein